ncbi:hypothetical protein GCM10009665_28740 [Kitasatospora nipponensis]|uniref:Uncharacterized protein n=1 Tax=Kitasatospora nipponensis TaxID=258049 RepID=A0ABP4GSP7_9ACTN
MPIAEDPQSRPADDPVPAGPDPFDGIVLDEDFIRGAVVKEPAARTRVLSARWRHDPPVDPGGRRWVLEPVPAAARSGSEWWRTVPLVLAAVVVVVLALAFLDPSRGLLHTSRADPPATTADPTIQHPFQGSPAADWSDNAGGIVLPAAQPVGAYSGAQVAQDLQRVKDFLVAANLDPNVIAGGYPDQAISLVDPIEGTPPGTMRKFLDRSLEHPSDVDDPLGLFSRFDPRQAVMVGSVVKVKGAMNVGGDGRNGLRIRTDYTFVYALRPGPLAGNASLPPAAPPRPGGAPSAESVARVRPAGDVVPPDVVKRTIVRRAIVFDVPDPGQFMITPGTLTIRDYPSSVGDTSCGPSTGFFRPAFPGAPVQGPPASTGIIDPYDRDTPIAGSGDCLGDSRN